MTVQEQSDLIATELIKVKIQGRKKDLWEFKKRLIKNLSEMDCILMNETPMLPNLQNRKKESDYVYFRQHLFVGMNRRRNNGDTREKKE